MIGGGPAGLSAAYQLALKGHAVTIFDERAELGGMMRYGIPGFRTPRDVLDAEIQRILDLGVKTRMNCRIGTDVTLDADPREFDAVFLGLGAQSGRALPVRRRDAPNCVTATAFLKAFNDGRLRTSASAWWWSAAATPRSTWRPWRGAWATSTRSHETDRPEHAIAGHAAHDVAEVSARQGAEVTLTSVFAHRQDAGQQARDRAGAGRRHRHPRRPGAGGGGARRRRPRHRAARRAAAKRRSSAAGSRSRTSKAPRRTSRPT